MQLRGISAAALQALSDALVGYRQSIVGIDDPEVVRTSGKTHHPIVALHGAPRGSRAGRIVRDHGRRNWRMPTPTRSRLTCGSRRCSPRASKPGPGVDARGKPPAA